MSDQFDFSQFLTLLQKETLPILQSLLGIVYMLIPCGIIAFAGYRAYFLILPFYKTSQAEEWMLVIRDGKMVKQGIGLCTWTMPGDQVVKFSSKLKKVTFNAEQVTTEMQGVQVSGMLIWSVLRTGDGPFKIYKCFGEDLNSYYQSVIVEKLQNMAVSIIRDRIANLTIDVILKNRSKLRDGVREELQKILNGWGMWVETIEIQDVVISSTQLFKNLQTEFREEVRLKAEKIQAEATTTIKRDNLQKDTEFEKKKTETQMQLQKRMLELQADKYQFEVKTNINKQSELQKLNQVVFETDKQKLENQYQIENKKFDQEMQFQEEELKLKQLCYTDNVIDAMVLETTLNIYRKLSISNLKVVQIGGGKDGGVHKDTVGQLVQQIAGNFDAIRQH